MARIGKAANRALAPLNLQLSRAPGHDWSDTGNFIPFEPTAAAARSAGMSIGDYVESEVNRVPGTSRRTVEAMSAAGVFDRELNGVAEIGPGTGRYTEKVLPHTRADRYEIYETAPDWRHYLVEELRVKSRPTDGYSMRTTKDASVDLAHAHKVFSTIPFMATCCYWHEFARVVRPGGWIVFDVMTEDCLRGEQMGIWARSGIRNGSFPAVMPKALAIDFFTAAGFGLRGDTLIEMPPGSTQVMIFQRG